MEVADIFRAYGAGWCAANKGHISLDQLRAISAIKACRTAVLGGHVARCEGCSHTVIGYNSCLMGKIGNGEVGLKKSDANGFSTNFHSPLRVLSWQFGKSQ
jgi:hypothetical protein